MESELERFHKQNTQLELNITELRQKLKATDKEMHQERQRVDMGAMLIGMGNERIVGNLGFRKLDQFC